MKKTIIVERESLITALRMYGFAIPDSAQLVGCDELIFEYDADSMHRFKITHYELKGYRDGVQTTEEPGDWQSSETGVYTRVVEAEDLRKAIALAGPIPLP